MCALWQVDDRADSHRRLRDLMIDYGDLASESPKTDKVTGSGMSMPQRDGPDGLLIDLKFFEHEGHLPTPTVIRRSVEQGTAAERSVSAATLCGTFTCSPDPLLSCSILAARASGQNRGDRIRTCDPLLPKQMR